MLCSPEWSVCGGADSIFINRCSHICRVEARWKITRRGWCDWFVIFSFAAVLIHKHLQQRVDGCGLEKERSSAATCVWVMVRRPGTESTTEIWLCALLLLSLTLMGRLCVWRKHTELKRFEKQFIWGRTRLWTTRPAPQRHSFWPFHEDNK